MAEPWLDQALMDADTGVSWIQFTLVWHVTLFLSHVFLHIFLNGIETRITYKTTNLIFRKIFVIYSWKFLEGYFVTFFLTFSDRFSRIPELFRSIFYRIQTTQKYPEFLSFPTLPEMRTYENVAGIPMVNILTRLFKIHKNI